MITNGSLVSYLQVSLLVIGWLLVADMLAVPTLTMIIVAVLLCAVCEARG